MTNFEKVLIERDCYTHDDAAEELRVLRCRAQEGEDPEELLHEYGLGSDYVSDLNMR